MATGNQQPGQYGEPRRAHTGRHPAAYGEASSGPRANFGERVSAAGLDLLILGIPAGIVYSVLDGSLAISLGGAGDAGGIGGNGEGIGGGAMLGFTLVAAAATFIYQTYYEGGASGQTVGKRAVGIRVLRQGSGEPLGFKKAVIRYFARLVSLLPFFLGLLWMLWDADRQTWHDKLTGSIVVPTWAHPVE